MAADPSKPGAVRQQAGARHFIVAGRVQGVGFRPFVFRLAHEYGFWGSVQNTLGEVQVTVVGGNEAMLHRFERDLIEYAPPLARPRLVKAFDCQAPAAPGFRIIASEGKGSEPITVPPDYFACDDCLRELEDPENRRYGYPFINCTQCGPRYTLIESLPYDRVNTTMSGFTLCPACRSEYEDPLDRRFHAEPVACPVCGPRLEFSDGNETTSTRALKAAAAAIQGGRIIAMKGVGGYHLVCDAENRDAIAELRHNKVRPDKPLAVMFPWRGADGLDALRRDVRVSPEVATQVLDPSRAIVLARRRSGSPLPEELAPGLAELGVFLPYSPLHDLLLGALDGPLVMTSGNLSGEPVLTNNDEAEHRLKSVADAFLHHNRPIARPADDPVCRPIEGRVRTLRLGRGVAPLEFTLPTPLNAPVLALGAQQKNTVALGFEDRVVVSPHIGDMGSVRAMEVFARVTEDLQSLYGVSAERLLCDAHPGFATHRWAQRDGRPVSQIFHHRAHASALLGEVQSAQVCLVFAWDGVGLGEDGSLWGGETYLGRPGDWRRVASLRSFSLPGGESAGREPWRSAAALCWEVGRPYTPEVDLEQLAYQAWTRGINCPVTSAVGRLFDGFAALALNVKASSYEGQAPMVLEAACKGDLRGAKAIELPMEPDEMGIQRVDWEPLLEPARDPRRSPAERARCLHASLANNIIEQAKLFRTTQGVTQVGFTGGVFQNKVLTEAACAGLRANGFEVLLSECIPCNDGGLSFGQVVEFAASGVQD